MIYTLGESLLDIIIESTDQVVIRPGGAMLNASVSLARAGKKVSLISELGDDKTSTLILDFLKENKVGTHLIKKYFRLNSTIALAHLDTEKKATYSFYKSYPEQRRLLSPEKFQRGDILLFGSMYSIDNAIRNPLKEILALAKKAGVLLCYDPNIRNSDHLQDARLKRALFENFALADLVKASDEDLDNIFGKASLEEYHNEFLKINPYASLIITRGASGVAAFCLNDEFYFPAIEINPVSTIGAGDAFNAGMVYALSEINNDSDSVEMSTKDIEFLLRSGLHFAAEVCTSHDNYIEMRKATS